MARASDITEPGEVLAKDQKPLKPRDAATLVILDRSGDQVRVLMGRRRDDLAFMAGKYVFPGGRVDPTDRKVALASDLRDGEIAKLLVGMRGAPSSGRARALALAAIREAYEEAGLIIGGNRATTDATPAPPANWTKFFEHGFAPALASMTFFARAITPPGRPRRFDTRFFCIDAGAISERLRHNDGELSALDWLTFSEAKELDIPRVTRLVLEDLAEQLADKSLEHGRNPVPFYYMKNGSFKRDLIRTD